MSFKPVKPYQENDFREVSHMDMSRMEMSGMTEEQALWNGFRLGDAEAYALIYRKYFFVLYQYGKKLSTDQELIKDSIQDIFIKIWNNRENLQATTSIRYYLLTALKRKLLDVYRSGQSRIQTTDDEALLQTYASEEEQEMFSQKEEVLKAMNCLSNHQQKLLHLKFYKNLSNQEIADELGITLQSVYNAVFKTLKSLKKHLSVTRMITLLLLLKQLW